MADLTQTVRAYILEEFLPGENPDELKDDTPLVTGGILDSTARLKLIAYLEDQFRISIEAHEASDVENLETVAKICRFVQSKAR
jgi:acyl carrier protein